MLPALTYGIQTPPRLPWPEMAAMWGELDAMGFASLWLSDHLVRPYDPSDHSFEAWTLLSALAGVTERARIGVLVSCNTFRHPGLLAKMAITLDHVSGGRLNVGLGAGWFEPEHEMYGIPFPERSELVARFAEAVAVLDLVLRERTSNFDGTYYRLREAQSYPAPLQQPRPPLTLAAYGPRMIKIVARYADRWSTVGTIAELPERVARLEAACAEIGRPTDEIVRSLLYVPVQLSDERPWDSLDAFMDFAGRAQEVGMTELLLQPPPREKWAVLEQLAAGMATTPSDCPQGGDAP